MRKILHIVVLCALASVVTAKPAYRGPVVRTAIDGTEKTVYMHGDELSHFVTDEAGQWLDEKTLLPLSEQAKVARMKQQTETRVRRAKQQTEQTAATSPNLAPRGLVILVNFQDVKFATPRDTIDSLLNAAHFSRKYSYKAQNPKTGRMTTYKVSAEGSARRYFQDQSYGQYNPIFDVVGPVTISREMAYYGENDSYGNDKHPGEMVKEACQKADALGVNFALYSNINQYQVDFVYVIYAGYGEADGGGDSTVWPHQHMLSYTGNSVTLDGKRVNRYACGCEMNHISNVYDGIGTFCHEFGHVIGLPDFYETNNPSQNIHTLGSWDIMDYGPYNNDGNTPPSYSAYERFFMGWLTPRILKEPEYVTLAPINEGNGESLMIVNGDSHNLVNNNPNPTTFYLLEARKQTGWDLKIPGPGMLITKIQYNASNWTYNSVNNDADNMGVDILEAKANTGSKALATDAYPAGATQWTAFSGHEVTDIVKNSNGSISFSYRGAEKPNPEAVEEVESEVKAVKRLRDGKIVIVRDGKEYDILGRLL